MHGLPGRSRRLTRLNLALCGPARLRKPRRHLEDDLQKAVVQHLEQRLVAGAIYWATPNGGVRSPITAALLKATGTKAGIPDIFILNAGQLHGMEQGRTQQAMASTDRLPSAAHSRSRSAKSNDKI